MGKGFLTLHVRGTTTLNHFIEYERDSLGYLRIVLPKELQYVSDFLEDIVSTKEVNEYIDIVERVLDGLYEEFEIQLNATSALIKKNVTIVEHFYTDNENNKNRLETEKFKDLLLVWKDKLPERYKST